MTAAILLAALSIIPRPAVVEDRCDVVEHNTLYDGDGRETFAQIIGWTLTDDGYRCQWWRLVRSGEPRPERGRLLWLDGEHLRRVRHGSVRRSWTQHDPELLDREKLPTDQRRELSR